MVPAPPGAVVSFPLVLTAAPETVSGRHDIRFLIDSDDGRSHETVDSSFFGPTP